MAAVDRNAHFKSGALNADWTATIADYKSQIIGTGQA